MSELSIINQIESELNFKIVNIEAFTSGPRHVTKWDDITTISEFLNLWFRVEEKQSIRYDVKFQLGCYEIKGGFITSLVLINLGLKTLPKSIFKLKKLRKLILNSNSLTSIDDGLRELSELQFLDVSNNNLNNAIKILSPFPKLEALDLSYNDFNSIELNPQCLPNLCSLFLSGTKIKNLDRSIIELNKLWICHDNFLATKKRKNKIVREQKYEEAAGIRDKELKLIKEFKVGLYIYNCSISNMPPEVLNRGTASLLEYWKSLEGNRSPLNEVKLILVGEGGSGKTSLLKRLTGMQFDPNESQTHGINIKQIEIEGLIDKTIIGRVWDFGGQEIMHSTHQFFLSKRSIYLVVIDSRKNERVEYWLKHIESFGGDSPIIVAINKIDENPSYDVNRKFLSNKYPTIRSFNRISSKTYEGLNELNLAIVQSLQYVQHLNTLWRDDWFKIKDELTSSNSNFISYTKYETICKKNNVFSETEQSELLSFLSDLGIMLNYNELKLRDTNVLNPKWLTNAVYRIINSKLVAELNGILELKSLSQILDKENYPREMQIFMIDLMKKFELCYSLDEDRVLIPDLLGMEEPIFKIKPRIRFLIKYSFLPKSIIPRLIVRLHNYIAEGNNWRTGAILNDPQTKSIAIIKSDDEDRSIIIEVEGFGNQARDFFSAIRYTLSDINKTFEKIQIEERVFVPNSNVSISYDHLISLENKEIDSFFPEGADEPISVSEILGAVTPTKKENFENRIMQYLEIILSKYEDRETVIKEANKIIDLKPNIAGIGINVNALLDRVLKKKSFEKPSN